MSEQAQPTLFTVDPACMKEWEGMPEFVQEDLRPHRVINVRFRTDEDVEAFAKLLGQTITPKQKALWFPEAKPRRGSLYRYVEEEQK